MIRILLDTGPVVAFLNKRDKHHSWAREIMATVQPPALTCESVLSEACFLMQEVPGGTAAVMALLQRGLVKIAFTLENDQNSVARLLTKYADIPMSLADACIVRMSEQHVDRRVMTIDTDFKIYRRNGRQRIPTIMPSDKR